jgi:arylsulfatase A-like enzyme
LKRKLKKLQVKTTLEGSVLVFWSKNGRNEARWIERFSDMKQGGKTRKMTNFSTHIVYENIEIYVVGSSVYFATMLKM